MGCCGGNMSYHDDMHRKMTGKTKGRYLGKKPTYSSFFGKLKPGQVVILPDDWNFEMETLFERVSLKKEGKA